MALRSAGRSMDTPMKLSAAERSRPTLWDGLLALLVLCAAVALLLWLRPAQSDTLTATIVLDGVTLGSYDLMAQNSPQTITVDAPWPMELALEHGRIRVTHSDCGSQDCVRTGWAHTAGQQIICLPNRMIISLDGTVHRDFDAVSG